MNFGRNESWAGVSRLGRLSSTPSAHTAQMSQTFQFAKYSIDCGFPGRAKRLCYRLDQALSAPVPAVALSFSLAASRAAAGSGLANTLLIVLRTIRTRTPCAMSTSTSSGLTTLEKIGRASCRERVEVA